MNIGGGNMNLTIQNQATKNVAVLGYVALYLCLDRELYHGYFWVVSWL